MIINVEVSESHNDIDAVVANNMTAVNAEVNDCIVVQTNFDPNHALLSNRDIPDQHPIAAISELDKQLSDRLTKREVAENEINNIDIDKLFKLVFG